MLIGTDSIPSDSPELRRLKAIANVMDSLVEVPVLRWRIGVDGLLGLVPGLGDVFGLGVSGYFIYVAAKMQVSGVVLTRMVLNVVLDAVVGAIPFVGDLFDFVFKANRKNLEILEKHVHDPARTHRRSMGFLLAFGASLFAGFLGVAYLVFLLAQALVELIRSIF